MNNPWEELKIPAKDVSAKRVDAEHPLDFFWAKDHIGRYLFLYEYPHDSDASIKNPPDLAGIETISRPGPNRSTILVFVLKEKANWEIFLTLCKDLLRATQPISNPKSAPVAILQHLRRWHEFLKKNRLDILTEEKIKGLIGELIFLKNFLSPKYGIVDSVKSWVGPEGSPQDFNINDSAIEVKCQLGTTTPYVKISSAEQLQTQMKNLYLFVITLGKATDISSNSVNLPDLIDGISNVLASESPNTLDRFQDYLSSVGYFYSDKYKDYQYLLLDNFVFHIKEDFPRIVPTDLKPGIIKLTYHIGLSDCKPYEIDISNWEMIKT